MISKKDSDSDSALSISEMGVSSDLFSSYDLDSDSLLSQSELTTAIDTAMSQFDGEMPSKEEFQSVLSDFGFETPRGSNNNSLSSSQKETISSVLENYDSSNLSQSDALEIVAAFKEAGIKPSAELASAMEEAGFDAQEVGTLAGVGAKGQAGGGPSGGGGQKSSEEEYDAMDTNEDGVVSASEIEAYYGTNNDNTSEGLSSNQQNSLDNLQLLMETLKSSGEDDSISSNSFSGLLKAINNQNNHSEINTYLQNSNTSNSFGYA
jgi:Ca2+-binding EF-hand superfamily protein